MQQSLDEERTSNTDEQEEFDRLDAEIKAVDGDLVRLRAIEKSQAHSAKPVTQGTALDVRSSISVKGPVKLPPGIAFARLAMAKAISFKEMMPAWEVAKQMWPDHDELHTVLKAAVVPGSSSTLAPLMQPTWMATEMIEYLWHRTIVGRVQGLRRVPFNIKVPRQTSVASVSWVGEAAPKPLSAFALDTVTLGYYKIAGIVALTDEIVKLSNPSAEAMVRDELANAIVTLMDHDFIDPEKGGGGEHLAGIDHQWRDAGNRDRNGVFELRRRFRGGDGQVRRGADRYFKSRRGDEFADCALVESDVELARPTAVSVDLGNRRHRDGLPGDRLR